MIYDQRDTFDNKFKINERLLFYMYMATKSTLNGNREFL